MMIGDFTEDDVKVALLLLDNIEDVVVVVVAPVVEANIVVATKRKKNLFDASKSRRCALKYY